ncbi:MAG: type II toxin-antitoxin system prevent-host-death family antitoxin [Aeromicrobium sp.]
MTDVPVREMRNHTAQLIQRVRDGEDVTITSNGVAVATLVPITGRRHASFSKGELVLALSLQADSGLTADLAELAGDTTDDLDPIQ